MFKSSDFKLLHAFSHYIINCDKKKHYLQKFVNSVVISGTYPQNQILKNCFYPFAFSQKWQPLLSSKKSSQKWQPLLLFLKILSEVAASAVTSFIHWKKRQLLLKIRQPLPFSKRFYQKWQPLLTLLQDAIASAIASAS